MVDYTCEIDDEDSALYWHIVLDSLFDCAVIFTLLAVVGWLI